MMQCSFLIEMNVRHFPNSAIRVLLVGDYFSCDMERDSRNDFVCQIRQDTSDQFDWTWRQGRTPTGTSFDRRLPDGRRIPVTGPERAQTGAYYLYIEASGRRNNEVAR